MKPQVKLTLKVQKNMFEHAKNRKKFLGGVSLDPLATLAPSALEEPPNFFHLPMALGISVLGKYPDWFIRDVRIREESVFYVLKRWAY